ncbi:tyrosine-type recombinase/integrase [Gordonia westfalica]|uniref:Site-specific recombinase XerD n=1 Tax=Gordonia westfalica TaxID=158898 RepID=A0A1H2KPK9_9ACTN|nr:site-specific integrase [Gordonia westfalica]SDU70617.1 Site-specific recombinase XerD [Gordonia westfalica]
MGRRRLEIGVPGKVTRVQIGKDQWRARCRVRCRDGQVRVVQSIGPSGAKAEAAVLERATRVADDCGVGLKPSSSVRTLADQWIRAVETRGKVSPQSIAEYRRYVAIITAGIGDLELREASPSRLDRFVADVAADRPAKAKMLRTLLRQMFAHAIRHDAVTGMNPAREMEVPESQREAVRALTLDELRAYREHVRLWEQQPSTSTGRGGRPRVRGLLDLIDLQLATGARIGELLALRWCDVDFEASPATATISGTLVRLPGRQADGGGLVRQPHPKTAAGWRVVTLPGFAVATLMRLKVAAEPNAHDVVFASSAGTLRDPHNVRRQLRDARGETFAWVKPHTFRKTVATLVEREASLTDAAAQLGHSGTEVTTRHYVQRAQVAPDLSGILDLLAPATGEGGMTSTKTVTIR